MKPLTKLYLKLFLYMGISYAILMVIIDLILGQHHDFWYPIFFGIVMSLVLGNKQKRALREMEITEFTVENLSVKQYREIESAISLKELSDRLNDDVFMKSMKIVENENGFIIKPKISWNIWSQNITITIKDIQADVKTFYITSKPSNPFTFVDSGRNLKNINMIEDIILNN